MWNALVWFFNAIIGIDWLEIIKALAPLATAFIAIIALRNWKRQDRPKGKQSFSMR